MASVTFDSFHNIVNNKQKGGDKQYYGINPWTEEKLWPVPVATEKDLDEAVVAGNAAFQKWRRTPVAERKKAVNQLAEEIIKHKDEWIKLTTTETGKPAPLAESEVQGVYAFLTGHASFDLPEHVTHEDDDVKVVTKYVPIGLVAGICPWNYPLLLGSAKIAAAVLTGNTIILKPSPYTPYTNLKVAEIASHIFPPGVVQALGGDDNLGPWMTKHPDIGKISFTGSGATGKKIMQAAAPTLKRVTLELGGNDSCIICPDVDLDKVVKQVAQDAFGHGGQVCVASKRIYVHSSIYDDFLKKLVDIAKTFAPGTGFLSPIQNKMQYDKVKSVFDDCVNQKYDFALGDGKIVHDKAGYFAPPTIISKPPEKSRLVVEEPFGPILPVMVWDDEEDVIQRANDTTQGLGNTLFCKDQERAQRIAERLESGSVWVNRGVTPMPTALFGGHKQSGIGGEWGPLGLISYCNAQTFHYAKNP